MSRLLSWWQGQSDSTRAQLGQELEAGILSSLDPLEKKLRGKVVGHWVEEALAVKDEASAYIMSNDARRWGYCAKLLQDLIAKLQETNQLRQARFLELRRACSEEMGQAGRDALIVAYLRDYNDSAWKTWGDIRALRRRLDLDALRERVEEAQAHNQIGIELARGGASVFWAKALGQDPLAIRSLLLAYQPVRDWNQELQETGRWHSRLKLCVSLARLASLPDFARDFRACLPELCVRLEDPQEHPWVRRSLLGLVAQLDPARAWSVARGVLVDPKTSPKAAFLFRSLVLEWMSQRAGRQARAESELVEHWGRVDPSEHVRLRLAKYCSRLDPGVPGILDALVRSVLPSAHADASERVRARAVQTAGHLLRKVIAASLEEMAAPRSETLVHPLGLRYASLLESVLSQEEDPKVLQTACSQMVATVQHLASEDKLQEYASMVQGWERAMIALRGRGALPAFLEESIAAAQEDLALTCNPDARAVLAKLRHQLRAMQVGERRRITREGPYARLSDGMLGRAIAQLSREDWGVYLASTPAYLVLQRGERKGMRGWRIWHEFTHPSPHKRQGYAHTTGRHFHGDLRAHPLRLDEATPTTVPGERVTIPQEQGCARHVPFVDDLLSSSGWGASKKVQLFSSLGVTSIRVRGGLFARLWLRMRLNKDYAKLDALRRASLRSDDSLGQRRFIDTLSCDYGVDLRFRPYRAQLPVSARTRALTGHRSADSAGSSYLAASGMAFVGWDAKEWVIRHGDYLASSHGNTQLALSIFVSLACALFLVLAFARRVQIRRARESIPLSIGGWGTRGKSGTERLKAAMLHGLGYRVFSKTTGCEAMFMHSEAGGGMSEIFTFRPYGKATIWEQRDLLQLAGKLPTDVFLWECMALNPRYVSILQHSWMRDDLATITNAYPDHEDIQGPAGVDVAQVIASFVPERSVLVSSEINFAPLFRDRCAQQRTHYVEVPARAEVEMGRDFLELFPYQEHPRNIALVAQTGQELGMDADLAVYNMAEYVVPDLGVLKTYGDALVLGRTLRFINGCSANERAGFMSNWERTGCDALDANREPLKMLALVVNNRADRLSRTEVFSKIMVRDAACDRFVLIGTNLGGLRSLLDSALDTYLKELLPSLEPGSAKLCLERFEIVMARHRCAEPTANQMLNRLIGYAAGAGRALTPERLDGLGEKLEERFKGARNLDLSISVLLDDLNGDREFIDALDRSLEAGTEIRADGAGPPECMDEPELKEVRDAFVHALARHLLVHRLRLQVQALVIGASEAAAQAFRNDFCAGYRSLFEDSVVVVDNAGASGDEVLEVCARSVPPGVDLTLMGAQNIKGTGLDFVYRWVALDQVQGWLARAESGTAAQKTQALLALERFGDHGRMDLSLLGVKLEELEADDDEQATILEGLRAKQEQRVQELAGTGGRNKKLNFSWFWAPLEAALEFLDAARRFHQAQSLKRDLIAGRVSHERAGLEMREIYARAKGGWLSRPRE